MGKKSPMTVWYSVVHKPSLPVKACEEILSKTTGSLNLPVSGLEVRIGDLPSTKDCSVATFETHVRTHAGISKFMYEEPLRCVACVGHRALVSSRTD